MGIERRYYKGELRVSEDTDSPKITGYAALYNSLSEDLGGFREVILPGAFDEVISDDVRALWNHDDSVVLGRTKSKTLRLWTDNIGLAYEITPPDTQSARDVVTLIKRGDIDGSSFGFLIGKDKWEERSGKAVRVISSFSKLYDVSPVTYPAYTDTQVALRSLETFQSSAVMQKNKNRLKIVEHST
jgi:HK97 family phage prohead protease